MQNLLPVSTAIIAKVGARVRIGKEYRAPNCQRQFPQCSVRARTSLFKKETRLQDQVLLVPADPLAILKTVYGYDAFRGRQREIIERSDEAYNDPAP